MPLPALLQGYKENTLLLWCPGLLISLIQFVSWDIPLLPALLLRATSWAILGVILLRYQFTRRFNCMQLHVIWTFIGFGLWPFGMLASGVIVSKTGPLGDIWGAIDTNRSYLQANDLMYFFLYLSCASYWQLCRLFRHVPYYHIDKAIVLQHRAAWRLIGLVMLIVGLGASFFRPYLTGGFDQVAALLIVARFGAVLAFALVAFSGRPGEVTRVTDWAAFLGSVFVVGVVGFFQGQGHKGALVITMMNAWLLYFGMGGKYRWQSSTLLVASLLAVVAALPYLNTYKSVAGQANVISVLDGVKSARQIDKTMINAQMGEGVTMSDYIAYYFFNRITTVNLSAIYVEKYRGNPYGYDFLSPVLFSFVPRVFSPQKVDSNEYYNEFARLSGVGNYDDTATSRKPALMDEFYSIGGMTGVIIIGLGFGLLMALIEYLLSQRALAPGLGMLIAFTVSQNLGATYLASLIAVVLYYVGAYYLLARVWLNAFFRR